MLRLVSSAALALLAVGCSNTIVVDDDGGGGSSSSSHGTTSPTTGTSSTGGLPCQAYADESATFSVTFHIENQAGLPVYLPADCETIRYQLDPASGPDGRYYGDVGGACSQTCEDLQTEGPIACEPCAPSVYELAPGAAVDVVWSGLAAQSGIEMPAACWYDQAFDSTCTQLFAAAMQKYTVSLSGFSSCSGECSCDDAGFCFGDGTGQTAYATPSTFDPSSSVVNVIFDVCAFGCPAE
jgi:hypothetical protein